MSCWYRVCSSRDRAGCEVGVSAILTLHNEANHSLPLVTVFKISSKFSII